VANPKWLNKYLVMKPEITRIFNDLDAWLHHCRINLIKFDPADMYKSKEYKDFQRTQEYLQRKARREAKGQWENRNGQRFSR
jgi:hypothetical protein